jgi:hypothetical protein
MKEPIKLYFDKVDPSSTHGFTTNGEKILYNLKLINEERFQAYTDMLVNENKATMFVPTGRFLTIISASIDTNEKYMRTYDLFDNAELAEKESLQYGEHQEIFMAAFWVIRETYKKDNNEYILVAEELSENSTIEVPSE